MDLSEIKLGLILAVIISLITAPASAFFSDGVFGTSVSGERRFLQAKKPCPVNFENQNYTIFTSKCSPPYPPNLCCAALKEFACPFADYLNDLTNTCASTMFSYIDIAGKYPPGMFSNECREGNEGLACPDPPPPSGNERAGRIVCELMLLLTASIGLLLRFL